jgi:hypothetical protein
MNTIQFWILRLRKGKDDKEVIAENSRRCIRALQKERARNAKKTSAGTDAGKGNLSDNSAAARRWSGGM